MALAVVRAVVPVAPVVRAAIVRVVRAGLVAPVAVAARVAPAVTVVRGATSRRVRIADRASAPTVSRYRVRIVRRVPRVRIVRPGRMQVVRLPVRASDPTGSPCRRSRRGSASRSAPTPRASDPMEPLGIPSVARSGRPSAARSPDKMQRR